MRNAAPVRSSAPGLRGLPRSEDARVTKAVKR